MRKPTVACALVAALVARHRWGSPMAEDALLGIAALSPHEYPRAREVSLDDLRARSFVNSYGDRGIELDSSQFGALAEFLFQEWGWDSFQIRTRLKHYGGWDRHDWA